MLPANTYPPVPETTGLVDSTQFSLLRLLVGLKLTAQRKKAADQKLLSAADTGCGNSWQSQHWQPVYCNTVSMSCKSGCACSTPLYTGGGYSTYLIPVETNRKEAFFSFFYLVLLLWTWQLILLASKGTKSVILCSSYLDLAVSTLNFF